MNVMQKTASIIVLIVLLALSGQAQPTYIINHLLANASLLATSGCVEAQIFVDGADLVTRHGELVTPSDPAAGILIRGYDTCLQQDQGGHGETDSVSFTGDLESASLIGDIRVVDYLGNVRNVPVACQRSRGLDGLDMDRGGQGDNRQGRVWPTDERLSRLVAQCCRHRHS